MGLDVYAIRGIVKVADTDPEDDTPEGVTRLWANPYFPGRNAGAPEGTYSYKEELDGPSFGYGYYRVWRETLAKVAGYRAEACWAGSTAGRPFDELINFTDCEGTIGPVVAAKLARDFAEYDDKARAMSEPFYKNYCRMRAIMEFAANDGAVKFT